MKGSSQEGELDPTENTPLGQFLSNGAATIARQEQQVSAKLDKLNDIAISRGGGGSRRAAENTSSSGPPRDEDSIVHLLNSTEYDIPEPAVEGAGGQEFSYYPDMSPPETLPLPAVAAQEQEEGKTAAVEEEEEEEPLPYSRPVPDTTLPEPQTTPSPVKAEKKTINLQTYLKRKKEDDLVEVAPAIRTSPPRPAGEDLTPTKVVPSRETDLDDLLEWASQDTDVMGEEEGEKTREEDLEAAADEKKQEDVEEEDKMKDAPPKEKKEIEEEQEGEKKEEEIAAEKIIEEDRGVPAADLIRSPSTSPIDSLLEEKLASPSAVPLPTSPPPPLSASLQPETMEEGELPEEEEIKPAQQQQTRSRSASKAKRAKKDKKKKKKKSKKRGGEDKSGAGSPVDSDLEEDIRKLEYLKAELEREERREKREKERKREQAAAGKERKRSPSRLGTKDKRKKDKRQKR